MPIDLVIALLGAQAKATQAMSEGVLNTRGIQTHFTCELSRLGYSHEPKPLMFLLFILLVRSHRFVAILPKSTIYFS